MRIIEDNNAFLMAMGAGSRVEIHTASAAKDSWTQIEETVSATDITLKLAEDTGWQVGDKIVIAASGFDMEEAEERTIVAVSKDGRTVTLDVPLKHRHLGEIRTYDNGLTGEEAQSWDVDMRAEVALLSRNVTIQGDADSAEDGYGGHTMIMTGASMHIDGAELTKMGQLGEVGRYPLHWHFGHDATGQYVTNSSIHETFNKGITVHGTQNTWLENLAIYDTIGHTYYFEDGSEFGNVVKNSLGMNTRAAADLEAGPIGSDFTQVSTYWVTNPANHLIDNHAAGSEDTGFWILSQEAVQGKSLLQDAYANLVPREAVPGQWTGNLSHSNGDDGLWIGSEFDETDGSKNNEPALEVPFKVSDFTTYSNDGWGIWQRNGSGDYEQIKIVESEAGVQMWGSSRIEDSLFVGRATNEDDALPQYVGWQLYDNPTSLSNVHFEGYTGEEDTAISNGWGFGRSVLHNAQGLTFADDGTRDNKFLYTLANDGGDLVAFTSDQGGPTSGGVVDIDGSLTGQVGAVITPGLIDWKPDAHVDVLNYANDTILASGFNASEGAFWSADNRAWIHQPNTIIGKMVVVQQTRDANGDLQDVANEFAPDRIVYTVERSDNAAKIEINEDAMVSYAWHMQLNVDTSDGVEYIFDYANETPHAVKFELTELPDGATAYYRFKSLPDGVVFQGADAAESVDAFEAATGTTWIREANGDYLVKAVATKIDYREPMRSEEDFATTRVYTDDFRLVVLPTEAELPTGDDPFQRDLQTFVAAKPLPLPERESTSSTVEIAETDARWSNAASWDNGVPAVDDIVIVGPGQTMVLDTYAKVGAILVNGGELLVEDTKDLQLAVDWILVINGGLFQVGTEDTPFVHDFELTLEGDDANNDVNVMALLSSDADNIVRAVETDPNAPAETTQSVVKDQDGTQEWNYQKTTFDAEGQRIAEETVYDDGRVETTSYFEGVKAHTTTVDAEGARDWDRLETTFDATGAPQKQTQTFDDGRVVVTDFEGGIRKVTVTTDPQNVEEWDQITTNYAETGDVASSVTTYDDGRIATATYENGTQSKLVVEDTEEAYTWTQIVSEFYMEGIQTKLTQTNDDGSQDITTFEDGDPVKKVSQDLGNAHEWREITTIYNDEGQPDVTGTVYEDGRIATTTYTDGIISRIVVEDRGETYDWATQDTSFAANGARLTTTETRDDGQVIVTEHASLQTAINIAGGEVLDANGITYEADPFTDGNGFFSGAEIIGTESDGLYQTNRWNFGTLEYEIGVEKGNHLVELNFAELFGGTQAPGSRVFDVYAEDQLMFDDLDVAAQAGFESALDLVGSVDVTDGALSLKFVGEVDNPNLSALSIWSSDGTGSSDFVVNYADTDGLESGASKPALPVTITPINTAPTASDTSATLDEDGSILLDLAALVTDVDGDILTITPGDAGFGSISQQDGQFVYTPDADFNGTDSFTYQVSDGVEVTTATVNLTITAVDDLAHLADDEAATDAGTAVAINVQANDSDVEDAILDIVIPFGGAPSKGTASVNADGSISYDPNGAFETLPDGEVEMVTFEYTASQASEQDRATVTVEITGTFVPDVVGPALVEGTNRSEFLFGTAVDEIIVGKSGSDRLYGEGGADVFDFTYLANDGARSRDMIYDFDADDSILMADADFTVTFTSRQAIIRTEDGDRIGVVGSFDSVDELNIATLNDTFAFDLA